MTETQINLMDVLRTRARNQPQTTAYTFINETTQESLTYQELLIKVEHMASTLQTMGTAGSRALLLLPPGLDYIITFYGCLMAGIIAVPAYPPRGNRHAQRIAAIIDDAQAELILTTANVAEQYQFQIKVLAVDEMEFTQPKKFQDHLINIQDIAFLQYTSGSTGTPKGVQVTHANIMANTRAIHTLFEERMESICSWVPPFHDMGLIGAILYPLACGLHSILMAPTTFLKKPFIWLKAISDYQVMLAPAPNFSYDICATTITAEEKKQLDLSHWVVALNGAEPVSAKTLARFSDAFKECGFHAEHCYPAYGMAETTLMVSGKAPQTKTTIAYVDKQVLQNQGQLRFLDEEDADATAIVGCGYAAAGHELQIIDPQTCAVLAPNTIGEIVVQGPSIAEGYWRKPELSQELFGLQLANHEGTFLRTGDLGFLNEQGELFVTGRLKDLIILRGHNIYPQDIEGSVHDCHPALIAHGCAAFTQEIQGELELVLVQEIHRHEKDHPQVFNAILERCREDLPLLPAKIVLIRQATLPKTSSGKVQRSATRTALEREELALIAQWQRSKEVAAPLKRHQNNRLIQWMQNWLATHLEVPPAQINIDTNLAHYGVDSSLSVQFCGALESELGYAVNPSLLWEYSSLAALAQHLEPQAEPMGSSTPVSSTQGQEPMAIIGMSCRLPGGVNSPEEFWQLLMAGKDGISEVPAERWNAAQWHDPQPGTPGKIATRKGGFIDHITDFDAALFGINRQEAEAMDPQHRLLLELSWQALEYAGIAPLSLAATATGVFVGIASHDYQQRIQALQEQDANVYFGIGNAHSAAAGRLAYFFGTQGHAITVDTACSSSLVAVYHACQELQRGECSLAIVGGVNALLDPTLSASFSQAGMLSPEGKCQVFAAQADGYVRSEGGGIVILKRLADAQRDQDRILAVIHSAVVNSDGRSNGITAPNPKAQQALLNKGLQAAQLEPDAIDYIEAHGTGTRLGDPIEFNALKSVYATGTRKIPLQIGSVKSNIGHLEAAAGMAGLIKTVLMLQHQRLVANLHVQEINPLIQLDAIPAQVPTSGQIWQKDTGRLRFAGVSSFGFTGTNAHVIVSEPESLASKIKEERNERPLHLLTLSGHSAEALDAQRVNLIHFLQQQPALNLAELCHSLAVERSALEYRMALLVQNPAEALAQLHHAQGIAIPKDQALGIVFLFTGQGAQYVQMGKALYEGHPFFRQQVDLCSELLQSWLPQPLTNLLFADNAETLLQQTQYTQPALFVIEYALAQLWMSWGIKPAAVIGHSVGEYVAATIVGVMSLADGLKLIAERARLMQAQAAGGMLAVNVNQELAVNLLDEFKEAHPQMLINLAAINSVTQIVVSGTLGAIKEFQQFCVAQSLKTRVLPVSHAFHSAMMQPMLKEFQQVTQSISYHPARIPLISNVSGQIIETLDAAYWVNHVVAPVKFSAGIQTLLQDHQYSVFLEMGPQPLLLNLAMEHHPQAHEALWLPSLTKNRNNWETLFEALAALYLKNVAIDWAAFDAPFDINSQRMPLPTYAFQRERYWLLPTVDVQVAEQETGSTDHSLLQMHWEQGNSTLQEPVKIHSGLWLIFWSDNPVLESLQIQFKRYFPQAVFVYSGQEYCVHANRVEINEHSSEHYQRLLQEFPNHEGILYCWGLEPFFNQSSEKFEPKDLQQSLQKNLQGLLYLAQNQTHHSKPLFVITHQASEKSHHPNPFGTTLIGLGKSILLEFPQRAYYHLDVVSTPLTDKIITALAYLNDTPDTRGLWVLDEGQLWSAYLKPITPPQLQTVTINSDGAYIITGGLGGIGLILCQWLLRHQVKEIILLGRRPLTQEWQNRINQWSQDVTHINYYMVDVGNREELEQRLSSLKLKAPVKGIFHTAGVLRDGLLPHLGWSEFAEVLQAKVWGGWNLHQLSQDLFPQLDHFVLFSSISSLLGSVGQGNYAAANAFLDGLAGYRHAQGLPVLTINYGPWKQIGMTKNLDIPWDEYGIEPLDEEQGVAAMMHLMSQGEIRAAVVPNHFSDASLKLPALHQHLLRKIRPAVQAHTVQEDTITKPKELSIETIKTCLEEEVRNVMRLGAHEELPGDATLLSLGMDSLVGMDFVRRLQKKLALPTLSMQSVLFENRNLEALIIFLQEKILEEQGLQEESNKPMTVIDHSRLTPLSVQQTRIWRHIQQDPKNPAYVITNFFQLEGEVDAAILEQAIREVLARHAMLRGSIHTYMSMPFQYVHEQVPFSLDYEDISHLSPTQRKKMEESLIQVMTHKQFDLAVPPLLASTLLRLSDKQYLWGLCVSHMLVDGSSSLILFQDILHVYALKKKTTSEHLPAAVPYQEFINWQLGSIVNGVQTRYEQYWQKTLKNYQPPQLTIEEAEPKKIPSGAREALTISHEVLGQLQALTRQKQITLPNLLLTVYGMVLANRTERREAFITLLCGGRDKELFRTTVGNIANELPVILKFSPGMSFIDAALYVQNHLASAMDYQYMQPEQIKELNLATPEISFDFQHLQMHLKKTGFTLNTVTPKAEKVPLWGDNPRKLSLKLTYDGTSLNGYLKYRADYYHPNSIKILVENMHYILQQIIGNSDTSLDVFAELSGVNYE